MKIIISVALTFLATILMHGQTLQTKKNKGFTITITTKCGETPVKDQFHSGTCWSFSTASFFESEIIKAGKPAVDLSEMFVVRKIYELKERKHVRMMGTSNFGAGGEATDMLLCLREFGLMPEQAYPGNIEDNKPKHFEMDNVLSGMVSSALKLSEGRVSPLFHDAYRNVLDVYLGKVPEKFEYENKMYTPSTFAENLGLNADDYIAITSFAHHPFYSSFILEVPDNWSNEYYWNLPLDEFEKVIDEALLKGYTVAWSSDVSEKGFSFKDGIAIVPEMEIETMKSEEKDSLFNRPVPQKKISQQLRQQAFDELATTDDHGMHIIGIGADSLGQKYYYVKNSWGSKKNDLDGYFFASAAYVRYKTTGILVNKNAVSKNILSRLNK